VNWRKRRQAHKKILVWSNVRMVEPIKLERSDDIVWVTLNRPQYGNALTPTTIDALERAIEEAAACGCRLFVLRAVGKNFCTGFDLTDIDSASEADLLLRFVRIELLLQKLASARFATLALISGRAIGAGADLAVACDRRVVVGDASFAFPGAAFGLILGTHRLAERTSNSFAREVVRSGRTIGAAEARAAGLATAIASSDDIPGLVSAEAAAARRLDGSTSLALAAATRGDDGDRQLAALVRSAARCGFKERIVEYRTGAIAAQRAVAQ
jgi:enoyl-CoA hydratase/carnithine racemase